VLAGITFAMPLPSAVMVVGGAGCLGRVIVRRWMAQVAASKGTADAHPRVVSVDRRPNSAADDNILVDLCNADEVERLVFGSYAVQTMLVAVKPPLVGPAYQEFIEVNLSAICELARLAEKHRVRHFVYVSSIAAANHWVHHVNAKESDAASNPRLTELRSPYDVSKQIAERFILMQHTDEGMRTVSIRLGGLYGEDDDPYWARRLPFGISFDLEWDPKIPVIDSNYVENVAEAMLRVVSCLSSNASVGGKFYFYTHGDRRASQAEISLLLAQKAGKLHIALPFWAMKVVFQIIHMVSVVPLLLPGWPFNQPAGRAVMPKSYYSEGSMLTMACYNQTFDNSRFRSTFGFSHVSTVEEAVEEIHQKAKQTRSWSVGPLTYCFCALLVASLCCAINHQYSSGCLDDVSLGRMVHACIFVSSPITHLLGWVLLPAYKLWQPFKGGTLHVALQGTAWTLFSIICLQWLLTLLLMISSRPTQNHTHVLSVMEATDSLARFADSRGKALSLVTSQLLLVLSFLVFRSPAGEAAKIQ